MKSHFPLDQELVHTFIYKHQERGYLVEKVKHKTYQVTSTEVIEAFTRYLKNCGFHEKSIQDGLEHALEQFQED